jgi:thiamine-monophosphate kinase
MRGEFEYIRWIRQQTPRSPGVAVGIGDDTAALRVEPGRLCLLTSDMILDGVHFESARVAPRAIGRKAMNVNLSDIAAMGGRPTAAIVCVGLPRTWSDSDAQALYGGLREAADAFAVPIVGGDTNASQAGVVVCVTILGEAPERGAVLRSGARAGDWVLVTGSLGGSLLGHHLDFIPRVREARMLCDGYDIHAMIDVSDGLAADLSQIAAESGCGMVLRAESMPIRAAAHRMPGPATPLEHALYDGEDFELAFTCPADDARRILADPALGVPIAHIGMATTEPGLWLEASTGAREALEPRGYDHFRP